MILSLILTPDHPTTLWVSSILQQQFPEMILIPKVRQTLTQEATMLVRSA